MYYVTHRGHISTDMSHQRLDVCDFWVMSDEKYLTISSHLNSVIKVFMHDCYLESPTLVKSISTSRFSVNIFVKDIVKNVQATSVFMYATLVKIFIAFKWFSIYLMGNINSVAAAA